MKFLFQPDGSLCRSSDFTWHQSTIRLFNKTILPICKICHYISQKSLWAEDLNRPIALPDDVSEKLLPDALVDALRGLGLHVEDEGEDAVHPVTHNHLVIGVRLEES